MQHTHTTTLNYGIESSDVKKKAALPFPIELNDVNERLIQAY